MERGKDCAECSCSVGCEGTGGKAAPLCWLATRVKHAQQGVQDTDSALLRDAGKIVRAWERSKKQHARGVP